MTARAIAFDLSGDDLGETPLFGVHALTINRRSFSARECGGG